MLKHSILMIPSLVSLLEGFRAVRDQHSRGSLIDGMSTAQLLLLFKFTMIFFLSAWELEGATPLQNQLLCSSRSCMHQGPENPHFTTGGAPTRGKPA